MKFILASSSPRRSYILAMLGFDFITVQPRIKEEFVSKNPVVNARRLALRKAFNVWKRYKEYVVIGADTIVFLEGKILGKPKDKHDAIDMLKFLSGKWHNVVTAISIVKKGKRILGHDVARVKFRNLKEEEIERYVASGKPLDKAGSYGIQDYGATFVEKIEGDFYTVMGMSPRLLITLMERL